jgi:hypothetical protein
MKMMSNIRKQSRNLSLQWTILSKLGIRLLIKVVDHSLVRAGQMKKPKSKKPKIFEKEIPFPGSFETPPPDEVKIQRDPGDETDAYDDFVRKVLELLSEHDQNQPDLHPSGGNENHGFISPKEMTWGEWKTVGGVYQFIPKVIGNGSTSSIQEDSEDKVSSEEIYC